MSQPENPPKPPKQPKPHKAPPAPAVPLTPEQRLTGINETLQRNGLTHERRVMGIFRKLGFSAAHSVTYMGQKEDKYGEPFDSLREIDIIAHHVIPFPPKVNQIFTQDINRGNLVFADALSFRFLVECKYNQADPYILFSDYDLQAGEPSLHSISRITTPSDNFPRFSQLYLGLPNHDFLNSLHLKPHYLANGGLSLHEKEGKFNNGTPADMQYHEAVESLQMAMKFLGTKGSNAAAQLTIPLIVCSHPLYFHSLIEGEEMKATPIPDNQFVMVAANHTSEQYPHFVCTVKGLHTLLEQVKAIITKIEMANTALDQIGITDIINNFQANTRKVQADILKRSKV